MIRIPLKRALYLSVVMYFLPQFLLQAPFLDCRLSDWLFRGASSLAATNNDRILHVLNRLGYGPQGQDVETVRQMGVEQYIEQQLSPESIPEPEALTSQLNSMASLYMTPRELYLHYGPPSIPEVTTPEIPLVPPIPGSVSNTASNLIPLSPNSLASAGPSSLSSPSSNTVLTPAAYRNRLIRQGREAVMRETRASRLLRALESPRQLQESLVDFWFIHFNIYSEGMEAYLTGSFENEAIRPHVLGRFRDLLGATAHHPAMLVYLDNWKSSVASSPSKTGHPQGGLNENYARELMELHTLGVNGGYTQDDVIALARILTGWGISLEKSPDLSHYKGPGHPLEDGNGFFFDPRKHDFGEKHFLGHFIHGSGLEEGEQALDILASSPVTAQHICFQLAQYFVADNPPPALVKKMAQRYLDTDGSLREVMSIMIHSKAFWASTGQKYKTPYQFIISSVRASGLPIQNTQPLENHLLQLGMPLYNYLTPEGYKNTQQAWLSPDNVMRRIGFVTLLSQGSIPIYLNPVQPLPTDPKNAVRPKKPPVEIVKPETVLKTEDGLISDKTKQLVEQAKPSVKSAILLGCPELMYH